MENINDDENVLESQEEEVLETSNEESDEETSTESKELQDKLAKAEELANNYKIRAEKAERMAKVSKPAEAPKVSGDLSTKDIYALMDAKVPEEDITEVQEYATMKKISIAEALKSNVVKTILGDKQEQRKVASAANVGTSKRGSGKVSDDILLSNASQGKETDPEALAEARMNAKLSIRK